MPGTMLGMIDPAFLRLSSASYEDMLTDAAVHVVAERGAAGLSTSASLSWLRVTPQRVSQMVRRDDFPGVVAARFCTRWTDWLDDRRTLLGAACLVPDQGSQVAGVQLWLALGEIARGRPDVCEYVACAREHERQLLVGLGLAGAVRPRCRSRAPDRRGFADQDL